MRMAMVRASRRLGWLGLLCLAMPAWTVLATPSSPERIEWHGKSYDLLSEPLEQRYPGGQGRPHFRMEAAKGLGAERGYAGRWRLEDDRLYLVDIDAWFCGNGSGDVACRRATLPLLFGAAPGQPIFADWFNGELVLSEAAPEHSSRVAARGRTIHILLKAGKVARIETVDEKRFPGEGR